jgi:hypothetical protein
LTNNYTCIFDLKYIDVFDRKLHARVWFMMEPLKFSATGSLAHPTELKNYVCGKGYRLVANLQRSMGVVFENGFDISSCFEKIKTK